MKSLKPILGTGAETCENQATFNYLLNRDVETEELRLVLKITILFFAVGYISEYIYFSEDHVTVILYIRHQLTWGSAQMESE